MAVKVRDEFGQVRTVQYTHSSATVQDTVYLLGGRPMLAINSASASAANAFVYEGVIEYAKLSTDVVTFGATLYWDNGNSRFTLTTTSNTKAGIAVAAAGNGVTTVLIHLMPSVTA